MSSERQIDFVDAEDRGRYEARVRGASQVAFTAYERRGNQIVFTHTEVPDAFRGEGIGSALARYALDDARRRGLSIVAECPFIRAYMKRHPDTAAPSERLESSARDDAAIDEAIIESFPASDPPAWMP